MHTVFIVCAQPERVPSETGWRAELNALLAGTAGVGAARLMLVDRTPADQPFASDGTGPELVLEIGFSDRAAAGHALAAGSPLAGLPGLLGVTAPAITCQLMEQHGFPFEAPALEDPYCTFFVTYPGTSDDLPGWLRHYDDSHPPIMKTFPGIREVATYWPVEAGNGLGFSAGTAMQRNKVVFQTLADLIAALASPVMEAMRADSQKFPSATARATHFPMTTWRLA